MTRDAEQDMYDAAIDRVEASANELKASLDRLIEMLTSAKQARAAGESLAEIIVRLAPTNALEIRRGPVVAFEHFQNEVSTYRAVVFRTLVDREGMTFTTVGNLVGVSRQMVARLYRTGRDTY